MKDARQGAPLQSCGLKYAPIELGSTWMNFLRALTKKIEVEENGLQEKSANEINSATLI